MLKSVTRHVHLFAGVVSTENELLPSEDKLTLDIDPDNELNWNDAAIQKVNAKFEQLVEQFQGRDLTEYNLRRIGSDLEHYIRALLREGEITYNLRSRTLNYSMGFPQVPLEQVKEQQYVPEG